MTNHAKALLLIFITIFGCFSVFTSFSATMTSTQTGSWTAGSTWVGGVAPGASDDVVISTGHRVSLSNINTYVNNLTISAGAVLDDNNKKLTINGYFIINGTFAGRRDVTFTGGSGTYLDGNGTINIVNFVKGLIINNSTEIKSTANLIVTYYVEIKSNVVVTNNGKITINNSLLGTNSGSHWINANGSYLGLSGSLMSTGMITASASGNTLEYMGSTTQSIKTSQGETYHNLIISGAGTKNMYADLTLNGDMTISSTLNCNNYHIYIKGNWINTNTFNEGSGTVTFNGTGAQSISNVLGETFHDLDVNKSSGTLTLTSGDVLIVDSLIMTAGALDAGSFMLTLGENTSSPGVLVYTSGMIAGKFQRYVSSTGVQYLFPLGSNTYYRPLKLTITNIRRSGGVIASFVESSPTNSGLPLGDGGATIYNTFVEGYWDFTANGANLRFYNLELTANGFITFTFSSNTRLLTRSNALSSWTANGTHVSATGNTVKRTGLGIFSAQFALGNDSNCTLPSTSSITGSTSLCKSSTGNSYSVTNTSGSSYYWTITGGTQNSGGNTNSITVNFDSTGMTGNIHVVEQNGCGYGGPVDLAVAINPIPPTSITGKENVPKNATGEAYSITSTPGYTYIWLISGGTIASGQGTNSITVTWGSPGTGSIGVYVSAGSCGIAPLVEKSINIYNVINSIVSLGNLGDASTWDCDCIPTLTDNIRVMTSHTVRINANFTVNHTIINPGGILDATTNNKILTINGDFTVNGTFSGGTKALILAGNNSTIDGTGTINITGANIKISTGHKQFLATSVLAITSGSLEFTTSNIQITNYGNVSVADDIIGRTDGTNTWINGNFSILHTCGALLTNGVLVAWPSENTVNYCGTTAQTIKNPNSGRYHDLIVTESGVKTLTANTIIEGDLTFGITAQLDVSTSSFSIDINGNWIDTGSSSNAFIERNGWVSFIGTESQSITNGSTESFYNLRINKTSDTLTLNSSVNATNRLNIVQGIIKTGANKLTLGTSTSNEGILVYTSGRVIGNFERWVATTATPYLFPIGSETYYRPAQPNFNSITTSGTLLASFVESQPGNNGLTLSDGGVSVTNTFRDGYWTIEVGNGFASSNYYLELVGNGFTDFIIEANTRLLARTNASSAWVANGTHVSASGNTTKRSGMTIFPAEYAFGDDTDCSLDAVWTGSTNTDWNTGSNWSTSVVPGRCTDVIINQTSIQPILNDDVSCNNLTINAKACLTINTLKTLLLEGYLTINSDSTGSGSLLDKGTLSTSLPSRIIRYFKTNGGLYNYHYFSSPISDASSSQFIGAKVLYGFDEGNYQWTSLPATLPVGVGYIAHYVSDATVLFMGTLNTGSQTITSSYTNSPIRTLADEGWNLVGNPYPSAIDWETTSGWTRPNVDYTVYYRNGDQYATFNRSTSSSTNGGTRYIPPTTGFFVKCNEFYSNNSLTMNNDIRVSTIQGFYKPEQPDRKLKIKSEANGYSDEIVVLIRENSTPEYDGEYDGYKLYGSESKRAEIYTITPEGTELSINTIPLSEEYTVVPIGLWIGVSSEITLTSEDYNSFAGHVDIFLEDLYEDKLIDFRKDNIYKFDANPGSLTDRFRLHFLPILNPTVTYDDKVTPDGFQNVVSTDEQAGLENSVKIYSHKNNIYINITGPFLNNSVEIYDVLGKEIFRKHSLESNFEKITIENSGYYIVKVLTGENYYTKKVFIN